jgi:hypothetical protein
MRRDRVLVSRQRSRDPVCGQPPDRLAARLTAVTPRVPVAVPAREAILEEEQLYWIMARLADPA